MKCNKCDNEATVHEVTIKGGQRHEKHLCEACAKGEGMAPQVHTSLPALLTQYITSQSQAASGVAATASATVAAPTVCPACGTTYAQFRSTGLLGCPACYAAFESQLGPLLARAHEGGTHHVGKTPRGPGGAAAAPGAAQPDPQRAERVATLRKHLADAVAAEQYEKAAKLRDELTRLESLPAAPSTPAVAQAPAAPQKARRMDKPRESGESGGGAKA